MYLWSSTHHVGLSQYISMWTTLGIIILFWISFFFFRMRFALGASLQSHAHLKLGTVGRSRKPHICKDSQPAFKQDLYTAKEQSKHHLSCLPLLDTRLLESFTINSIKPEASCRSNVTKTKHTLWFNSLWLLDAVQSSDWFSVSDQRWSLTCFYSQQNIFSWRHSFAKKLPRG